MQQICNRLEPRAEMQIFDLYWPPAWQISIFQFLKSVCYRGYRHKRSYYSKIQAPAGGCRRLYKEEEAKSVPSWKERTDTSTRSCGRRTFLIRTSPGGSQPAEAGATVIPSLRQVLTGTLRANDLGEQLFPRASDQRPAPEPHLALSTVRAMLTATAG